MDLTGNSFFSIRFANIMRFESSPYKDQFSFVKKEFPFGVFYLCDSFYISEVHEGIHFDWDCAHQLADLLEEFYGKDAKVGWISNRLNSYSIDPQSCVKFHENYYFLYAGAIVSYNDVNYINATLEKRFSKIKIKRCHSLEQALDWITNFK